MIGTLLPWASAAVQRLNAGDDDYRIVSFGLGRVPLSAPKPEDPKILTRLADVDPMLAETLNSLPGTGCRATTERIFEEAVLQYQLR